MSTENPWYLCPTPDLTQKAKQGKTVEVHIPVSYSYNGGTVIQEEWFVGYLVPEPIIPAGFKLVDPGFGLQLNAHPPYATMWLMPV